MKLFSWSGRARRRTYALHCLLDGFVLLALCIALILGLGLIAPSDPQDLEASSIGAVAVFGVVGILLLGTVSGVCVTIRRLHDLGRSSWEWLLLAIPIYNIYLGLVLIFTQGDSGPNEYGPDPRAS